MSEPVPFATLLRRHRESRRWTQQELAEATVSVGLRTLSDLERGIATTARSATARQLADALGLAGAEREQFLDAARGLRRDNLPATLTSFIGRTTDIETLRTALSTARLLTLVGPGGCGKTRLALETARPLVDQSPDGVWFVDLAPVEDTEGIARAVLAAIGYRPPEARSSHDALVAWVARRAPLLILDNCEHLHVPCAGLALALLSASPGVRILATSRRRLGLLGERIWRVSPLAPPVRDTLEAVRGSEAVQLLLARAGTTFALTPANAAAVATLCRRLDGLPLALELAAPRLGALGAGALVARLDARFALLRGATSGGPERHQSLHAVLDWSHDLLTPAEQRLFRRLALFAGGFALTAAEAIDSDPDVAARLADLVDQSLVTAETRDSGIRYSLAETIRAYARERLDEAGETDTIEARRAAWCIALAERVAAPLDGGPAVAGWLADLTTEAGNLRAALAWAATADPATGLRLAAACWPYFYLRGDYAAGRTVLRAALDAADAGAAGRARVLYGLGVLSLFDDLRAARTCLDQVLVLADQSGDEALLATTHWSLAFADLVSGALAGAQAHLAAAGELVAGDDRPGSRSRHRMLRGQVLFGAGDLAGGRAELAAAYTDAVAAEQQLYQCMILAPLSRISLQLGLMDEVSAEVAALSRSAERLGSWFYRTIAMLRSGTVREWLGELEAAATAYRDTIALADEAGGNRLERCTALIGLGRIALYRGEATAALDPLGEAEALLATLRYRQVRRNLAYVLGLALWHTGQVAAGAAQLAEALDLPPDPGGSGALASCLEGLAGLAIEAGAPLPAARWLGAATALRDRERIPRPRVDEPGHAAAVSAARTALGEERYTSALRAGARQPVVETMVEARTWLAKR